MAGRAGPELVPPVGDVGGEVGNEIDVTNDEAVVCQEMLEELLMLLRVGEYLWTQQALYIRITVKSAQINMLGQLCSDWSFHSLPPVDRRGRRWKPQRLQYAGSRTGPDW